jgi:hypothetical protein
MTIRSIEALIESWMRSRRLRFAFNESAVVPLNQRSAVADLAATLEDAEKTSPTRDIDPAVLAAAIAASKE